MDIINNITLYYKLMKPTKPLGKKCYGSIPHLLGSKLGEGDHHIHQGQHNICTVKTRDEYDLVIVTEKYDGSNVAIAKINGELVALTKRGYTALSSPFVQHHAFDFYVKLHLVTFDRLLKEGERICGEWMFTPHGIKYNIEESAHRFIPFDIIDAENKRIGYDEFVDRATKYLKPPRIINIGYKSFSVKECLINLYDKNQYRIDIVPEEKPEGLVYRVERKGKFDFIAKHVRSDFETGKYLNL